MTVSGLILHFGYVESSRASVLIVEHSNGFDSLEEAVRDFAHFCLDDYLMFFRDDGNFPTVRDFAQHLYDLGGSVAASGLDGMTFLPNQANRDEGWDAFVRLSDIPADRFCEFYENSDRAEDILIYQLDPSRIDHEAFRAELLTYQAQELPDWAQELRDVHLQFQPLM